MTDDDFTVIWRGLSIGRIMQASGRPPRAMVMELLRHQQARSQCQRQRHRLEDCKAKFKVAWAAIRAGLSEDDIASAHQYAENSREALARYDRKQRR